MSDKPSWSETPNIVFELMPHLSGAQFKILMLICRKTYGYHEESARIDYNEFMDTTGLTKQSVHEAVNWLADEAGIIKRQESGKSRSYSFDYEGTVSFLKNGLKIRPETGQKEPVEKVDRSKNQTDTGMKTRPIPVKKVDRSTPVQTKKQKTKLLSSDEESAKANRKIEKLKKPKESPEATEKRRALLAAWLQVSGAKNYSHAQVNAGIAQLERAGVCPDELVACHDWMKEDPYWSLKTIYPQSILKKLDEYHRWLERKANTYGAGLRAGTGGNASGATYNANGRPQPGQGTQNATRAGGAPGGLAASNGASPGGSLSETERKRQFELANTKLTAQLVNKRIDDAEYQRQYASLRSTYGLSNLPGSRTLSPS